MQVLTDTEINFAQYEHETDAQQKVKPASLWVQDLIERLKNPRKVKQALMPWRKTHALVQFRPGEVTVWGGANGNGKSLVTGQVSLALAEQGERICIASFEMKPEKTLERMARQWSGHNPGDPAFTHHPDALRQFVELYEQFRDWTDTRMWLYDQQGTVTGSRVCAVARYCAKELKVTHFFVDSLMKCVAGEDDYNGQKMFVDELTAIARDYGMHIHLVHHIRKPQNEDHLPNKYDYKGSGSITDQVDNVISVWRNKKKERDLQEGKEVPTEVPDCKLICDKQRNGEWEGVIGLWFDRSSQQFVPEPGMEAIPIYCHPED